MYANKRTIGYLPSSRICFVGICYYQMDGGLDMGQDTKYYIFFKGMDTFIKNYRNIYSGSPDVEISLSFLEWFLKEMSNRLIFRSNLEGMIEEIEKFNEVTWKIFNGFPHYLPNSKEHNNDLFTVIASSLSALREMIEEDIVIDETEMEENI